VADDSCQLLHTKHIPDDVWNTVMAVRKGIVNGEIKLTPVFDAQKVRALMTSVEIGTAQ
jgi:basic membrane protein A